MASSLSRLPQAIHGIGSRSANVVIVLLSLIAMSQSENSKLGVVNLFAHGKDFSFCLKYYPKFKGLPQDRSEAQSDRPIANMAAQDGCEPLHGVNLTGTVVLANDSSRCPLETVARNYGNANAYALIVGLSDNKLDDAIYERKSSEHLDIVVGFVSRRSFVAMLKLMMPKGPLTGLLFTKEYEMDTSLILVWFIATFSVAAGAFWAGTVSHQIYRYHVHRARKLASAPPRRAQIEARRPSQPAAGVADAGADAGGAGGAGAGGGAAGAVGGAARRGAGDADKRLSETSFVEAVDIELTPVAVLVFVVFMSSSLVIIYLLIKYIVYVIIGMFVLASSVALVGVLEPLVYRLPVGTTKLPTYMLPCFYVEMEVRQLCLIVLSVSVAFSFVVIRHHPKSWLLQDALGVIFCIYMIKTLRMPNLMVIAVLLVLLFFYDIFFVFLTPFILPKSDPHNDTNSFAKSSGRGDSIMVEVARGGGTDEMIPMVMRVPRFGNHDLAACFGEWSLLGLGDILIPGFLVAYVHSFDLVATGRRLYYTTTVIAYSVGLVVTFLALYFMKTAQPALLYLVPATLIPVVLIARHRGELREIWYGLKPETPQPSEEEDEPPAVPRKGSERQGPADAKEQGKAQERRKSREPSEVGDAPETRGTARKPPSAGSVAATSPQRVVGPAIRSPTGAASGAAVPPPALLGTMFTVGLR
ncbi:signal peptide peptidase-like 2B [Dermacentor albipictus]|uniref:signal peptide peptidase-like 2B n=1 Tax=Dermacentor albipictus TaxID=60249 RepID=UPI0031FCCE3C